MTPAEIERAIASKQRVLKVKAQEKATFDYILANLIGKSISRLYSSSANMPELSAAYPSLFTEADKEKIEVQRAAQKEELFALGLKQFTQAHNQKIQQQEALNCE